MTGDGIPTSPTEYVRITPADWGWFQWIDFGPGRPALVDIYDSHGYFRCIDPNRPRSDDIETTDEAIERITRAYPTAKVERLTWEQRWTDDKQRKSR